LPGNLREFSSAAGTPRRAVEAVLARRAEHRLLRVEVVQTHQGRSRMAAPPMFLPVSPV